MARPPRAGPTPSLTGRRRRPKPRRARVARRAHERVRRKAVPRKRRGGRAFTPSVADLVMQVLDTLRHAAPSLRKGLSLNLALMTVAMLTLWKGARSGNGWLTLCALSRALPLDLDEKMRSKRLYRLLENPHLDGTELTPLLVRIALGPAPSGWIPIVVDQTDVRGTQVLMAGVRVAGRTLPVAFATFEYRALPKSQNAVESALLKLVAASLPAGCKPLFVMDRGYARASLLGELRALRIPFLIRGRGHTMVHLGKRRMSLGRLRHRRRKAVRYTGVLDQDRAQQPVDVVVYHDPQFQEPWYLLCPEESECDFPTEEVVALYRERMFIELTFRDWKTHLGLRGLRLEVHVAARLGRLLLALTVAYVLAILLGTSPAGGKVRRACEVLRSQPRHGTRRRLGALSIGILLLSLARFATLAKQALTSLLRALARGTAAVRLARLV